MDRGAVDDEDVPLAAHLLEQVAAGNLASLDGVGHDHRVGSHSRGVDGDHDGPGGPSPFDRGSDAILVDGGDDDKIDALLDERIDLGVLVRQIKLRVLNVDRRPEFLGRILSSGGHGGEEGVGHVLDHQRDGLDLVRNNIGARA